MRNIIYYLFKYEFLMWVLIQLCFVFNFSCSKKEEHASPPATAPIPVVTSPPISSESDKTAPKPSEHDTTPTRYLDQIATPLPNTTFIPKRYKTKSEPAVSLNHTEDTLDTNPPPTQFQPQLQKQLSQSSQPQIESRPESKLKDSFLIDSNFNIKLFSGFNYCLFNQKANIETENGVFSQQTLSQVGLSVDINLSPKSYLEFIHRQIKASVPIQGDTTLDTTTTSRGVTVFGLTYIVKEMLKSSFAVMMTLKNELVPILSTDSEKSLVNVFSNELNSTGIGIKYNYKIKTNTDLALRAHVFKLMRARSQNGLSMNISDKSQFSSAIALNKRISTHTEVGVELETSQGNFQYTYHRNDIKSTGEIKLQDISLFLKMGFHF